jgi:hypothetical protein
VSEGRGFLAPPAALDALKALGFNLLSLSNNHAFDMQAAGIRNTIAEANRRQIVHAGIGNTLAEASAPAYLKTPKGTIALVSSASGSSWPAAWRRRRRPASTSCGSRRATRTTRQGRSAGRGAQHAERRGLRAHPAQHSRGAAEGGPRHRLSAQPRVLEPLVLDVFTYGLAERLAPNAG